MRSEASTYFSDIALDGPPLFFKQPADDQPVPITYNFDYGLPDETTFPIEDIVRLHAEVIDEEEGRALGYISMGWDADANRLQYLPTGIEMFLGYTGLRNEVAKWLAARDNRDDLTAENVIITCGSVHAISLAVNALVNAGDGVLVEATTFPYAVRYMEARKADVRTVDIDDDGVNPEVVRARLEEMRVEGIRPKLLYFGATFQCPTGATTSLPRRHEILALAEEFDFLILEDAVYNELRYSGERLPTLLELDQSGRVLQSSGFSKTVAPGLRLGWMTAPREFIAAMGAVRQDLGVSQLTSRVMEKYLAGGLYDAHIAEVVELYRRKRDIAAKAVRDYCTPYVTFNVPDGGCFLWLTMDESVDWEKARQQAEAAGVMFRPGERFMSKTAAVSASQHIRLAFTHVKEHELRRGIEVFSEAIKASVRAPVP